jgi:hypothetical protein
MLARSLLLFFSLVAMTVLGAGCPSEQSLGGGIRGMHVSHKIDSKLNITQY